MRPQPARTRRVSHCRDSLASLPRIHLWTLRCAHPPRIVGREEGAMTARRHAAMLMVLVLAPTSAVAAEWSHARIAGLPDSAFAVIETSPSGKKVRHLPHHDETGAVDPVHLRSALARLSQVRWLDPANKAIARRHLEEHLHEPTKRSGGSVGRVIQMR